MITYWILFLILFGAVVFIHELGHFTVAKLSGIYVERFALGFGPALIKKQWGETEYAICALPLGGYVKMRGEDLDEVKNNPQQDARSFALAKPWTRIAVAIMGPTANLVLPVVLFTLLMIVGMPTPVSQIGWVMPGSPAEHAGLMPGDRVTAVNGQPIWKWSDLEDTTRKFPGKAVELTVNRSGTTQKISVTPRAELDTNMFGDEITVGKVGISPNSFKAVIGIGSDKSPAIKLGLRTGDVIEEINGMKISYGWQAEEQFKNTSGDKNLKISRYTSASPDAKPQELNITVPAKFKNFKQLGVENGELYIREVKPGSVAAEKGIQSGDKLIAINGAALDSWAAFQQKILKNSGETISLLLNRQGKKVEISFVPAEIADKNVVTQEKEKRRQFGVVSAAIPGEVIQQDERHLNPFKALYHGVQITGEMTWLTIQGLVKLFTGQLSLKKSLGGPISIFYLAGGSYEAGGWTSFLRMMALLSITLGVINLLPIPVLDGGHIFFFLIEAAKGSPVSLRVREMAQQVGLILIVSLMILTFYVDIERYFFDRIKSLFN